MANESLLAMFLRSPRDNPYAEIVSPDEAFRWEDDPLVADRKARRERRRQAMMIGVLLAVWIAIAYMLIQAFGS
jgi:hypothetical protein